MINHNGELANHDSDFDEVLEVHAPVTFDASLLPKEQELD
jgi:hypothetical protein